MRPRVDRPKVALVVRGVRVCGSSYTFRFYRLGVQSNGSPPLPFAGVRANRGLGMQPT